MLRFWGLAALVAGLILVGCGGGGGGSTDSTTTKTATAPSVGGVKKCLRAGGATNVSGSVLQAGEGTSVGIVKATGPQGAEIQIALYETPSEAQMATTMFSSGNRDKRFENVGPALIVLEKDAAAADRKLAARCAGGPLA